MSNGFNVFGLQSLIVIPSGRAADDNRVLDDGHVYTAVQGFEMTMEVASVKNTDGVGVTHDVAYGVPSSSFSSTISEFPSALFRQFGARVVRSAGTYTPTLVRVAGSRSLTSTTGEFVSVNASVLNNTDPLQIDLTPSFNARVDILHVRLETTGAPARTRLIVTSSAGVTNAIESYGVAPAGVTLETPTDDSRARNVVYEAQLAAPASSAQPVTILIGLPVQGQTTSRRHVGLLIDRTSNPPAGRAVDYDLFMWDVGAALQADIGGVAQQSIPVTAIAIPHDDADTGANAFLISNARLRMAGTFALTQREFSTFELTGDIIGGGIPEGVDPLMFLHVGQR